MKYIYLFRHGETDWNLIGKFQGHADIPLNDTGREQARRLIEPLRKQKLEVILSSPLKRARETAKIIADALDVEIETEERIKEGNLGQAEGKLFSEIESLFGIELITKWKSSQSEHLDTGYPDGETGRQLMERSVAGLIDFLNKTPHSQIGVSCHGGVIRRIIQHIAPELDEAVPIPNGIVYLLTYKDKLRLENLFTLSVK